MLKKTRTETAQFDQIMRVDFYTGHYGTDASRRYRKVEGFTWPGNDYECSKGRYVALIVSYSALTRLYTPDELKMNTFALALTHL